MYPCDFIRHGPIQTLHFTGRGTYAGKQSFEFDRTDYILVTAIAVFSKLFRDVHIESGCHNNCTDMYLHFRWYLGEINSSGLACFHAGRGLSIPALPVFDEIASFGIYESLSWREWRVKCYRLRCSPSVIKLDRHPAHRTRWEAFCAGIALHGINISWFLQHLDREIACLSLYFHYLTECHELNIRIARDFQKLGEDCTHPALIRREHFVELGHPPSNCRFSLQEDDFVSLCCEIQCGIYTSHPGPDYQHRSYHSGASPSTTTSVTTLLV